MAAERYVEQNPVRAGLAATPWEYPWSSAQAHVSGNDDALVRATPLLERVGDWEGFLCAGTAEEELQHLRRHERTERPLGSERCLPAGERALQRTLRRGKPGPKPSRNS